MCIVSVKKKDSALSQQFIEIAMILLKKTYTLINLFLILQLLIIKLKHYGEF